MCSTDLSDNVHDHKSLLRRSICGGQQDGTDKHDGGCEDGSPLASNLVTKVTQSAHTQDDTNNLDVIWNLGKSLRAHL